MALAIPKRSEVLEKDKWNAPSVFIGAAAWEAACDELPQIVDHAAAYAGRLSEGAAVLGTYLGLYEKALRLVSRIMVYASMEAACDATNAQANAMRGRAQGLLGLVFGKLAFTDPELLAIGQDTLKTWITQEASLAGLEQYVDDLFRQQAHVRSAEVESVMGMANEPLGQFGAIAGALTGADMTFSPAQTNDGHDLEISQSTIRTHYSNPDRSVRHTAYTHYTDAYLAHKNTIAATYLASVRSDVFKMRVRGFSSSLEASLFANNIPREVHDNLINTYKANISTWHKYWDVRRRILGVDALQPYDIWAPLTQDAPEVPFELSVDWISAGMAPLGDDYVKALRRGCLEERWVDKVPNQGKREGAFSSGTYDTFPFIMMSYDDSMLAMSTLAHELGHSMHSYLARKNQPYFYAGYSLFVAEVASNFNQAMTRVYLQQANEDINFQIALIEEAMSNFHRYFFVMPTLARFEQEVHERVEKGMGMTAEDLSALCADLFAEGYGDTMAFDRDRIGITWATFQHLYNNFYVYQYATGISAAHALAEGVAAGDEAAAKRYLEFLSAGSSMYALDALRHAGVDMTKPDAVETTFGVLVAMVERLESLAGV